jgi:prepilin-type N-terminal cleavage/methylation domain-containing protein
MGRRASRSAGFTLVELMVALTISGVVIGAMYTLGSASSRNFQMQHQAANMQAALRLAMLQVQRDIARAGYLSTPREETTPARCADSGLSNDPLVGDGWIAAISSFRNNTANVVDTTGNNAANGFVNDQITLIGNYTTSNAYVIDSVAPNGLSVMIHANPITIRHATQVDFGWTADGRGVATNAVNLALVQRAFPINSLVRIESTGRDHQFVLISANPQLVGNNIQLSFNRPLERDCLASAYLGTIAPLQVIRYGAVRSAANTIAGDRAPGATGQIAQLVRTQQMPTAKNTPLAGVPARVVLDYLAAFDLSFTMSSTTIDGNDDNYAIGASADRVDLEGPVNLAPERVRAVTVTLAVRAPSTDPGMRFFNCQNLRCFQIDPTAGVGGPAARVRFMRSEIFLPNLALEGR